MEFSLSLFGLSLLCGATNLVFAYRKHKPLLLAGFLGVIPLLGTLSSLYYIGVKPR